MWSYPPGFETYFYLYSLPNTVELKWALPKISDRMIIMWGKIMELHLLGFHQEELN